MRCAACDTINTRTRLRCHHCQLSLHDPMAADGPVIPTLTDTHDDTLDAGWRLELRDNLDSPSPRPPQAPAVPAQAPARIDFPGLPELPRLLALSDVPILSRPPELTSPAELPELPELPELTELPKLRAVAPRAAPAPDWPAPAHSEPTQPAPQTSPTPSSPAPPAPQPQPQPQLKRPKPRTAAELAAAKADMRAAVRRSQLRRRPPATGEVVLDVLLLEAEQPVRAQLYGLLESFGYHPHVAVSVSEAEGLSAKRVYTAAFLGLDGDVSQAAELCRHLHDLPRGRPSAIIAMIDRARHADRVRMQLAGADQVIFRPVGRGDVARSLEACGLSLPEDPRLGARPET